MKKVISILIAVIIAVLPLGAGFSVFAKGSDSNNSLNEFVNGIVELTHEYDANKEFSVKDGIDSFQTYSSENNGEEYTLQDFQTARLIVRANKKFDDFAALKHVSGFEDFHILQYESPEAAMEAYINLKAEKNVKNVAPDEVVAPLQGKKVKTVSESELEEKDYLCDWSVNRTQSKRLHEYLSAENIPMQDVVIGVIDNGVYYDHKFLEGRILRTYYNNTESGTPNDEYGAPEDHGTAVCSVIVDNAPQNIKIKMFKVLNDNGLAPTSMIASGILEAVERNVDVISISLGYFDKSGLTAEAVRRAYACNIPMFACVSNDSTVDDTVVPANVTECIAVTSSDINGLISEWTTWTYKTDVAAPGEDIAVATMQDKYDIWSGTSFATPCAASLGAILKSVYPNITVDEIDERIKETAFPIKESRGYTSAQGQHLDDFYTIFQGAGMVQFCNALDIDKLAAVQTNLEDKTYIGAQLCSMQCTDKNAIILYTTDGTYPTLENAIEYTTPFEVTQRTRIRAVAYYPDTKYYSDEIDITPRIHYIDDESCFEINKDGVITKYKGPIQCLYVPETINGISVTGFDSGVFNNNRIIELTLPKTIKEIPENAFSKNTALEYISAEGVTVVCDSAFFYSNLRYAELPNAKELGELSFARIKTFLKGDFSSVEKINTRAFQYSSILYFDGPKVTEISSEAFRMCRQLLWAKFPVCKTLTNSGVYPNGIFYNCHMLLQLEMQLIEYIPKRTFYECQLKEANFPFVTKMDERALCCANLEYIYMPSLLSVPDEAFGGTDSDDSSNPRICILDNAVDIGENAFGESATSRAEFSHLEFAKSLPHNDSKTPCIISLPSTFKECTEDTKGRNYTVYGTKGTYAEQWANENGHTFVEISQDTAVLTPLPEKYTDADEVLTADVIGFNRTYQWYASSENSNTAGTPIPGATGKEFNPADYPAKYYYCVVTSTDVGYDSIEIRTGVCENTTFMSADYSEYDKVVAQAKALDRSLYTDLTELDEALSADISGLSNSQQNIVDEQTAKIKAVLDNLVLKPADYSRVNEQINTVPEHLEYYTDETVNALNKILNGIDNGLDITKQEVVDSYAEQLQNAISALEYKPADYTEYDKAVSEANGLDKEKYVDFSQVEKELAVDVGGRNITQQEEVDLQTKAILEAIDALEETPQEQPIINPEQDKTSGSITPDKPSKNESVISPMTGSETYTGAFITLAALSFATVLLVRKKKDN